MKKLKVSDFGLFDKTVDVLKIVSRCKQFNNDEAVLLSRNIVFAILNFSILEIDFSLNTNEAEKLFGWDFFDEFSRLIDRISCDFRKLTGWFEWPSESRKVKVFSFRDKLRREIFKKGLPCVRLDECIKLRHCVQVFGLKEYSSIALTSVLKNSNIESNEVFEFEKKVLRGDTFLNSLSDVEKVLQDGDLEEKFPNVTKVLRALNGMPHDEKGFFDFATNDFEHENMFNFNSKALKKMENLVKNGISFCSMNFDKMSNMFLEQVLKINGGDAFFDLHCDTIRDETYCNRHVLSLFGVSQEDYFEKKLTFVSRLVNSHDVYYVESDLTKQDSDVAKCISCIKDFEFVRHDGFMKNFEKKWMLFEMNDEIDGYLDRKKSSLTDVALSPSAIQQINKNPYFFWVQRGLRLKPLNDLNKKVLTSDVGTALHKIAEMFAKRCVSLRESEITKDAFFSFIEDSKSEIENYECVRFLLNKIASILVDLERNVKSKWVFVKTEERITGEIAGLKFNLVADRVEYNGNDVAVYDFKSGMLPSINDEKNGSKTQLSIAALLLKQRGFNVKKLEYISFLKGKVVSIGTNEIDEILDSVEENLKSIHSELGEISQVYIVNNNNFENEERLEHFARRKRFFSF